MEENKNAEVTQADNNEFEEFEVKEDRTFTQKEVNSIIKNRLGAMKKSASKKAEADLNAKMEDYNKKMAELDAREKRMNAIDTLRSNGMSEDFADILANSADQEKTLEVLKKHIMKNNKEEAPSPINGFKMIGGAPSDGNGKGEDSIRKAMGLLTK